MSARVEDFLFAAHTNNHLKLKNLLQHGVNIDCVNDVSFYAYTLQLSYTIIQKGQTALHICCSKDHVELVQFLCSSGANMEAQDKVVLLE